MTAPSWELARTDPAKFAAQGRAALTPAREVWLKGRVLLLLRHFYQANDTPQIMAGIGNDWQAVLGHLPEWAVEEACTGYHTTDAGRVGRKPTPGMIYDLAARKVADLRREVERAEQLLNPPEPERPRPSKERIA